MYLSDFTSLLEAIIKNRTDGPFTIAIATDASDCIVIGHSENRRTGKAAGYIDMKTGKYCRLDWNGVR
jgi:hypothetical protein